MPELQKPREPSNKEKEEAVQFSIEHKNGVGMIILPMDFLRILYNQRWWNWWSRKELEILKDQLLFIAWGGGLDDFGCVTIK